MDLCDGLHQEWWRLRDEWDKSFYRDEIKNVAFKNNKKNGYYLVAIDNKLIYSKRIDYILDTLSEQVGVELRHLKEDINLNELFNRLLKKES